MTDKFRPYNIAAGLGVQLKRIRNGTFAQTRFTRYIESIENLPDDELRRLQAVEMSRMLSHAVKNIPYYMPLAGEFELSPETVHDDILHFPVVTKKILGSLKEQFCDPKIPVIKSMYSGGTTMTRVSVDADRYSESHKGNEYFNRVAGIYPGMPRFMISRHESTYVEGGPAFGDIDFKVDRLGRTYFVNCIGFKNEKLGKAYDLFIKSKARVLKGNTAVLVEFAESIEKNGWHAPEVPIVFSGQNNMLPEYVETLERVFRSKVYNAYGATESGIVAAQCGHGKGLHYIPVLHFLETMDGGRHVRTGEPGSLVITSFAHYAMPIIRFQIGDYATLSDEKCSCGRTFPVIESINGRTYETINTPSGSIVSVFEAKAIFDKIEGVEDFQIISTGDRSIDLHIKTADDRLKEEHEAFLRKELTRLFEFDVRIDIGYVPEILRLPTGKILRILTLERYNEIKNRA